MEFSRQFIKKLNAQVTPATKPTSTDLPQASWTDKTKTEQDQPEEFTRNSEIRKSKTKRVKSFLKQKCKDAVTSIKNTGSHSDASPPTEWYVPPQVCETQIGSQQEEEIWETCEDLSAESVNVYQIKNSEISVVEDSDTCVKSENGDESIAATITENQCDVASLVDTFFGPLYSNYKQVRGLLIRQARDVFVCEYLGNLYQFEQQFCIPGATLLEHVQSSWSFWKKNENGSILSKTEQLPPNQDTASTDRPNNWPLSLSPSGIVLHLSPLQPSLLRPGDCYLCLQNQEIVLIYRNRCNIAKHTFTKPVDSIISLEMDYLKTESPELLQNLLISVEHSMQRVTLDDLAFPCPQCMEFVSLDAKGCCQCQQDVDVSPMFEFSKTIPHIDSDEDNATDALGKMPIEETKTLENHSGQISSGFNAPTFIVDLPEKIFMSGIYLPGTKDVNGFPLIVYEAKLVAESKIECSEIIQLLLYYASIVSNFRQEKYFTILVLAESDEDNIVNILSSTFSVLPNHLQIKNIIIWRRSESKKNPTTIKRNKLKFTIVSNITDLYKFITTDSLPISKEGIQTHDQLEWFEFFKEYEPFIQNCYKCGRGLASGMAEVRNDELTPQINRKQLNHQYRQLIRILSNEDLVLLRKDGPKILEQLEERAQWLNSNEYVQNALERVSKYFSEVNRVVNRLEQLAEQRRDRIKELARFRALEEEIIQVSTWLNEVGAAKLKDLSIKLRNSKLDPESISFKEKEFEEFYFTAVKYMDRSGDLCDETDHCNESNSITNVNQVKDLARNLKVSVRTFGDLLEESREYLEDLVKWCQTLERIEKTTDMTYDVRQECIMELVNIASKLQNEILIDKARIVQSEFYQLSERPPLNERCELVTSTPIDQSSRRKSISSFAYIYRCNHHAAGFVCNCWSDCEDSPSPKETLSQKLKNNFLKSLQQTECVCGGGVKESVSRQSSLGLIQEVRESAENLLETRSSRDDKDSGVSSCDKCETMTRKSKLIRKHRGVHRTCSCLYMNGNECGVCGVAGSSTTSGSTPDHMEHPLDTDGASDRFADKSITSEEPEDTEEQFRGKTIPPVSVNNHLYCHGSNVYLPSPMTALDSKTQKTIHLIMGEMIQTERDYVKSLDYIIENYIPELSREDIPQALRGQRNVVFGNVEKIYEFHSQHFLRELELCATDPLQVGQCFLRHEKKFYLYALYNKNKPKSDSLMSEYGTQFFKSKQLELCDKMDLASYLLKPVQRMGKYALLLQQLMKICPAPATQGVGQSPDFDDLRAAEQMVRFQLRHGNDLLAMDSLRDCDVNLKEQGRLLRQNEFLVGEGRNGKKHIRQVFLFEELILFSKANRFPDRKNLDLYIYKNSIKMSDIGLTEKIGDSTTKFEIWFRKRKRNDTFILQATSEEVKKAWTEEISQLLWKQAMRNREVRLQEMSSMGIGNKPCLDIRPSEDQISDRSISIAQLGKTPKFRNSTIGPIMDSCRGAATRTHSSASSLSSGSSSSSGSHRLSTFDCISPKTLRHTSITLNSQCSNESGIVADYSVTSDDYVESIAPSLIQQSHYSTSIAETNVNNNVTPQVTLFQVPDDLSINL